LVVTIVKTVKFKKEYLIKPDEFCQRASLWGWRFIGISIETCQIHAEVTFILEGRSSFSLVGLVNQSVVLQILRGVPYR